MRDPLTQFNVKVQVFNLVQSTRPSGDTSRKYVAVAASVPAKFKVLNASESLRYGRDAELRPSVCIVPPHITVDAGDRVMYGTRTFEVRGCMTAIDRSGQGTHKELVLEETR